MPQVHIEVGGYLTRRLVARDSEKSWERDVDFSPGESVRTILRRVAETESGFSDVIYGRDQLCPEVLVLINGKLENWGTAAQLKLTDGDRLSFYPMIGGG